MKQILSILAVFALVLPLLVANAQEEPKTAKDKKECVSKTGAKKGCCPSKAKASKTAGKVKLQKASNGHAGCSDKEKADCASKCASKAKHASAKKDNGQN
jgi:hypothetical protein